MNLVDKVEESENRHCLLPGDVAVKLRPGATVVVGSGLRSLAARSDVEGEKTLDVTVCGSLRRQVALVLDNQRALQYSIVSTSAKRYAPRRGDVVVGVVVRAGPTNYSLHIGSAYHATLDALAFDGASKVNRPKLQPGDLVYAHVTSADKDADAEVSCCAFGDMPAKDWATGQAVFGPLRGGASVVVPLQLASDLVQNVCPVLMIAGGRVAFEAAIGLNGRVWIGVAPGVSRKVLIALTRCVAEAKECQNPAEVAALVDRYFPAVGAVPAPPQPSE